MNAPLDFGRCLSFINCQLMPHAKAVCPPEDKMRWRAVTISRQAGSGGHAVAEALAGYLQLHEPGNGNHAWTIFDRNLIEKVLEEHHLPQHLVRFMPEDRISEIDDFLDGIFGLHPASPSLVEKTAETILGLAKLGHVILIGRGANVVTRRLGDVFHARLIGSLDKRVDSIQKNQGVGRRVALEMIRREDLGRRRYLRKYYGQDIDDPAFYHVIINTDLVSHQRAAAMIAHMMLSGHKSFSPATENLRAA